MARVADPPFPLPVVAPLPETHGELGRILTRHYGRASSGGVWIYVSAILFLAGIVQAFNGVASLISNDGGLDELATALGAFLGAGLVGLYCMFLWRQSLGIYEHGFAIHRIIGSKVVRWDNVESATAIRHTGSLGQRLEIVVEFRNGGGVTLTDALSDIEGQSQLFQMRGGVRG